MALRRPALVALAVALLALVATAAPAWADGTPNISLSAGADQEILYGDEATVTLTAANPTGQPVGYNLSLRAVLPQGVTYVPGSAPSGVQTQVFNNAPVAGQQTVVFSNVTDLSPNSSYDVPFKVAHNPAVLPVGATFTVQAGAYINSDARYVPQFTASGAPIGPNATSYTGFATTTHDVELLPFRVIREAPENQLRGAHDFQYVTRITIENNKVRPTTSFTLTDFAPAGVEVLACGTGDASAGPEYPGSGPLNPGNAPGLTGCVAPDEVTTVAADPGGLGAGTWTRQVWSNLGTLGVGGTLSLEFATAIPIRENTTTWPGGTPPTEQAANLDNNIGPETYDEQALAAFSEVSGDFDGTTYTADDTQTTIAEDLILGKSASTPTIAIGANTTWTLTARASEYRWVDNTVIVDTVPDGLCPLGSADYDADSSECDAVGPTDPYANVVENLDGTWTVTFDPLPRIAPGGSQTVELITKTRAHYQENHADVPGGDVLANDSWTNWADVSGNDFIICTGGGGPTDCAGHPKIDADETDGDLDFDAASAEQSASSPTLDKRVATSASGTDCPTATYTNSLTERYGAGDKVCWLLRMEFPAGTPTGNVRVTDFLPLGHSYDGFTETPASNVVIDEFDDTVPGLVTWRLGNSGVAGQSQVFEGWLSTIVNEQVSPQAPGQLTQNLLKSSTTNSEETSFPLRDDAGVVIEAPVVGLTKSVASVNGGAASSSVVPDDVVTYRVRVTNNGQRDAQSVEVWDNLPADFGCADVDEVALAAAPVPGACASDQIRWTIPALAAGASRNLEYDVTIPVTGAGRSFTNTAGVRHYTSESNLGTFHDYYPVNNIDPGVGVLENAAQARDTETVTTPVLNVTKGRTTEVNEAGNNAASQATIGEVVTYTVTFDVPAHVQLFGTAQLNDPLNSRQTLVPGSLAATMNGSGLPAGVTAAEVGNGVRLTFPADYVAGAADEQFTLTYRAQVDDDHPDNRRGGSALGNTATLTYQSSPGTNATDTASTTTTIVEPNLTTAKSTTETDLEVDPGQEIGYTVTATNTAGTAVSLAHQVSLVDTLPDGLTPLTGPGGSAVADGGTVGPDGGVWNATLRTITWPAVTSIAPGVSVSRTYRVRVNDPAVSQAQLTNTFRAATSSLGPAHETGGERSDPTPAAGYADDAQVTLDLIGLGLAKAMTPETQTIGGVVNGTLTVTVPANIALRDAYVTDVLPDGMVFDAYVSAMCTAGCGPAIAPAPLPTQDAGAGTTRLGWWIGDHGAHAAVRTLELRYRAHVAATVDAGDVLVNSSQWHLNRTDVVSGNPGAIPGGADVHSGQVTDSSTVAEPELVLDKDVSGDPDDDDARTAQPGDTFTYSIVVTNNGDHPAYDVTVADTPDVELAAITPTTNGSLVTDDWTAGDPDLVWTIPGPIAPGGSVTLAYEAALVASAGLTPASSAVNTADVPSYWGVPSAERTANGFDYREYTVVAEDTVTVDLDTPQVTLAKAASGGASAAVGVPFEWTVTLTNTASAATAFDADVVDTLPDHWTYDAGSATVDGSPVEPSVNGGELSWEDVADLAPGDSVDIVFTATPLLAAALQPNPHVNSAAVSNVVDGSGATGDADGSYSDVDDTADATLTIPDTDLAVEKQTTVAPVAGADVAWRITVTNNGPDGSPAVALDDVVPAGVTITGVDPSQGTCDNSIACSLGELQNGESATVDVTGTVDDAASQGVSLTNTVTVSDPAINDPDPSNDTDQTVDPVLERAELTLDKERLDPLVTSRQARWRLTVANHGPSVARDVTITDDLPDGLTFVEAPGCTEATGTVTCVVGDLAPGAVEERTITTTIVVTDGVLENTAVAVTPTPDLTGGPNEPTASADGPVTRPDLAIAQFVEGSAAQGSTVNYILAISNAGTAATYAPVTVVATMPDGLVPLSAAGDGWVCQVTGQTVTCTRSDVLVPGAAYPNIAIMTRVDAAAGTALAVIARVSTAGDIVEPNDTSQTVIQAGAPAVASCAAGGRVVVDTTRMWAGARYNVTGRVVAADGRVVAGQVVRVEGAGKRALSVRTSADGTFRFAARPRSGGVRIRVLVPGCSGVRATIASRRAESCRSVQVSPGNLRAGVSARVRVRLRAGGRRLGFAAVRLDGAGVRRTIRTDRRGVAVVRIRPAQAGIVSVSARDVARCTRRLGVVAQATARQLTG